MNKLTIFCKKHMNTILSIVSSLGVVSTAVLSGMATYDAVKAINEKKAETKKEKIKVAALYLLICLTKFSRQASQVPTLFSVAHIKSIVIN